MNRLLGVLNNDFQECKLWNHDGNQWWEHDYNGGKHNASREFILGITSKVQAESKRRRKLDEENIYYKH